jgi:hypothetical protein
MLYCSRFRLEEGKNTAIEISHVLTVLCRLFYSTKGGARLLYQKSGNPSRTIASRISVESSVFVSKEEDWTDHLASIRNSSMKRRKQVIVQWTNCFYGHWTNEQHRVLWWKLTSTHLHQEVRSTKQNGCRKFWKPTSETCVESVLDCCQPTEQVTIK